MATRCRLAGDRQPGPRRGGCAVRALLRALRPAATALLGGACALGPEATDGGPRTGSPAAQAAGEPEWGPAAGEHEFTLGGLALTTDGDDGYVSGAASLGHHASPVLAIQLRHEGAFADNGESRSFFTTRLAVDLGIARSGVRPFAGLGAGVAYGESVNETPLLGLHAGVRLYVQPRAFLQILAGYDHFVTKTEDETEIFEDEALRVGLSIGLHF